MRISNKGIALLIVLFGICVLCERLNFEIGLLVSAALIVLVSIVFRNPDRSAEVGENEIISPADGRISEIRQSVTEEEFRKEPSIQVVISIPPFDVQTNRSPVSGNVEFVKYVDSKKNASAKNEIKNRSVSFIGISSGKTKVTVRQVSGIIFKKIKCAVRTGDAVKTTSAIGAMKFGSRVDLFLPTHARISVKPGNKVKAGLSTIGVLN